MPPAAEQPAARLAAAGGFGRDSPSMQVIFRTVLVVVTGLASPAVIAAEVADGSADGPGPWRLVYRYDADEPIRMAVRHRAVTDTSIAGVTESVETSTDSTKVWRVVEQDADRATLEHSVEDVRMISRSSRHGSVRWDSRGEEPPPPGYESVPQSLGVPLSRFTVDATGHLLKRRDLRPMPASNSGDLVVVPLPREPVAIGDTWEVPDELVVELPGGPRKAVRTRLRYRLEEVADGIASIAVDTTVLTPIDDPRIESRLLERIWDGRILFDLDRGRVIRRSREMDRRVVGFNGPQSSLRYRAELEERLLEDSPDS
jgi:hypothetical protein